MDGVLHRLGRPIDGAAGFIQHLNSRKVPYIIMTNECRYSVDHLSGKLHSILGVSILPEFIYTAGCSAADFLCNQLRQRELRRKQPEMACQFDESEDDTIHVAIIGESGLVETVSSRLGDSMVRVSCTSPELAKKCDYVLIGWCDSDVHNEIERAIYYIQNLGAKVLYTCPDLFERSYDGCVKIGGPIMYVNLISQITNCKAHCVGKPSACMIKHAVKQMATVSSGERAVRGPDIWNYLVIGDSLNTDIAAAVANDFDSALVLTGTSQAADLTTNPVSPTYVFKSIKVLHSQIEEGRITLCVKPLSRSTSYLPN